MGLPVGVVLWSVVMLFACSSGERPAPSAETPPVASPRELPVSEAPAAVPADAVSAASAVDEQDWTGGAVVAPSGARVQTIARPLRSTRAEDAAVYVTRGQPARAAIQTSLSRLGVVVPRDRRVVIKINLGGYDRIKRTGPDDGLVNRITNPAFVEALIEELRARGVTDIVLADGASVTAPGLVALLEASGYAALSARSKVPFVNLSHYGESDERPAPWRMKLPWATHLENELVLSDELIRPGRRVFLIDVPKLKAHRFAVMSMSIKNLMGTVMIDDAGRSTDPWQRRWRMHRELSPWLKAWKKSKSDDRAAYRRALAVFSERLADLYGVLTPDLVLIEGFPAIQGDGFAAVLPYGGDDVLIASANGCYADYVGAEYFGLADSDALETELGVRRPPAITAVAERYYGGEAGLKKIEVRGDVNWRTAPDRVAAYIKGMAPFELGTRPK